MKIINLIIILVLLLTACGDAIKSNNENEFKSDDLKIEVIYPSGEIFDRFNQTGIPLFFNIARIQNQGETLDFIFPGERIAKGKKINVLPLSVLSFDSDTINYKFVVTSAKDSSIFGLDAKNYMDFSIKNYQTKELIEDWFKSNCQLGICKNFRWENELVAKNLVHKFVGENK